MDASNTCSCDNKRAQMNAAPAGNRGLTKTTDEGVEMADGKGIATLPHSHPRCGKRWGGSKTAHCSRCHETFTTPSNFDKHQRDRVCLDPALVGLVETARAGYTAWGAPADPNRWAGNDAYPFGGA